MKPKWYLYIFAVILLGATVFFRISWASAQENDPPTPEETAYFHVDAVQAADGEIMHRMLISGPPEPPFPIESMADNLAEVNSGATVRLSVPTSEWAFGCSATSAAMIAGYYDRNGYANMYVGPTNAGVYPTTSDWGYYQDASHASRALNPLSATKNGLDGRTAKGSVDDYWVSYGTEGPHDPWYGNWAEHSYEYATGDFMYTNQWDHGYENSDGSTAFYYWGNGDNSKYFCDTAEAWGVPDGTMGLRNFYQSRGYTVSNCYFQLTDNQVSGGFSFADFKSEIDAGRPVMVHLAGHTIVGTGYNNSASSPVIYINDTWDNDADHTMNWGGSYQGMSLEAVSIVQLADTASAAPENDDMSSARPINSLPFEELSDFNTRGASTAYDDPDINNCGVTKGAGSVWYTYTHTGGDSAIAIDTSGSSFDTFIAIWTGTRGNLTLVGCSNTANKADAGAFQISDGDYYIEIGKAE